MSNLLCLAPDLFGFIDCLFFEFSGFVSNNMGSLLRLISCLMGLVNNCLLYVMSLVGCLIDGFINFLSCLLE